MSRLEELLQTLCPDGVEFIPLKQVLDYSQPTPYIVKSTLYDDSYDTPVLTAGASFILGYTDEKKGVYNASHEKPVIIFDDFTTSFHWVDFNFKVKSSAMKILTEAKQKIAVLRYVFYAMQCIKYQPSQHARQWIQTYSKIRIPLPPLPVQEEIVRILDKFSGVVTELEQKLNAEQAARARQYEHYRNELLSFDSKSKIMEKLLADFCPDGVEYLELQQIFDYRNGYTPSRNEDENWNDGTISWFTLKDLRKNGGILSESIEKITSKGVKRELFEANSIIISTLATIGEHALILNNALANQQMTCLTRKEEYKEFLTPKFVYYYCFLLGQWCRENVNVSGFASVDMGRFARFKFPIPPLEVQEQIVSYLDRFDTLVNDLKSGLPAEIALRRKQYEYYRDKLLTFPQKPGG